MHKRIEVQCVEFSVHVIVKIVVAVNIVLLRQKIEVVVKKKLDDVSGLLQPMLSIFVKLQQMEWEGAIFEGIQKIFL